MDALRAHRYLRPVPDWVERRIAQGEPVDEKEAAAYVGRHPARFSDAFCRTAGCGYQFFVNLLRIERVCRLLQGEHMSLDAMTKAGGFGSLRTMIRAFVRVTGMNPGQYRNHVSPRIHRRVPRLTSWGY